MWNPDTILSEDLVDELLRYEVNRIVKASGIFENPEIEEFLGPPSEYRSKIEEMVFEEKAALRLSPRQRVTREIEEWEQVIREREADPELPKDDGEPYPKPLRLQMFEEFKAVVGSFRILLNHDKLDLLFLQMMEMEPGFPLPPGMEWCSARWADVPFQHLKEVSRKQREP